MKSLTLAMTLLATVVTFAFVGKADAGFPRPPKVHAPKKINPPKFHSPGKFQQKVIAGASVGAANGAAFGSFAGPAGTAAGAGGGAVTGSASVIIGNHAEKKWTGKGLQNWNRPKHW